jgi:hypothetical protein
VTADETVTLWRPVRPEELPAFNDAIAGLLEIVAAFGPDAARPADNAP